MRYQQTEIKNYILKTKRKLKVPQEYEEVTECKHISAWTFDVDEDRLKIWKDLLYVRYFLHIGQSQEINVHLRTSFDKERNIVEENYILEKKDENTHKKKKIKKVLDITIYYTTKKIMIRGVQRNEWKEQEFNSLKEIIDTTLNRHDIITTYCMAFQCKIIDLVHPEIKVNDYVKKESKENEYENTLEKMAEDVVTDIVENLKNEVEMKHKTISPKIKKRYSMSTKSLSNRLSMKENPKEKTQELNEIQTIIDKMQSIIIKTNEKQDQRISFMEEKIKKIEEEHRIEKKIIEDEKEDEIRLLKKLNEDQERRIEEMERKFKFIIEKHKKEEVLRAEEEKEKKKKEQELGKSVTEKINIDVKMDKLVEKTNNMEVTIMNDRRTKEKIYRDDIGAIHTSMKCLEKDISELSREMVGVKQNSNTERKINIDVHTQLNTNKKGDIKKIGMLHVTEETILIMDSNRAHIDPYKFWKGHTVRKLKAGNIQEAKEILEGYHFDNAKYIILHIGTNDVEKSNVSAEITKSIINIASSLNMKYKMAKVFVSQLPPRNDNLNWISQNVNNLMQHSLPESLYLIDNSNITTKMLYDKKHIREDHIGMLVYNMKKQLRKQ